MLIHKHRCDTTTNEVIFCFKKVIHWNWRFPNTWLYVHICACEYTLLQAVLNLLFKLYDNAICQCTSEMIVLSIISLQKKGLKLLFKQKCQYKGYLGEKKKKILASFDKMECILRTRPHKLQSVQLISHFEHHQRIDNIMSICYPLLFWLHLLRVTYFLGVPVQKCQGLWGPNKKRWKWVGDECSHLSRFSNISHTREWYIHPSVLL